MGGTVCVSDNRGGSRRGVCHLQRPDKSAAMVSVFLPFYTDATGESANSVPDKNITVSHVWAVLCAKMTYVAAVVKEFDDDETDVGVMRAVLLCAS